MAHQSLYRTYRPQRFEDVVGQSHVTRTLRNAVAENAVAHAYLFTGPRGTGKTTTARILAKALNCEKGPTPDFDDTCENCVEITEGRHPDVYELDAASRTGVDAIRDEVITKVGYASTRGGWKVYIIDEVHMLSTSAFNALLKTLEEPPSHTLFVLCTTHPNKVPETIHSRCQRFDFRRISTEDIAERLASIAAAEKIEVAPGALTLVAKHADGGMRDAISTLDQLAAFTGKNISIDDVEGLLGEVDAALLFEVADDIARRDVAECFRFVARMAESGIDVTEFVKSLIGHFRNLFVIAAVDDATGIVDETDENLGRLTAQSGVFGRERVARLLDLLGQLASDIRWAGDPRLTLEVALVRMARPQGDLTLEALEERIAALEVSGVAVPQQVAASPPGPAEVPRAEPERAVPEKAAVEPEGREAPPAEEPAAVAEQASVAKEPAAEESAAAEQPAATEQPAAEEPAPVEEPEPGPEPEPEVPAAEPVAEMIPAATAPLAAAVRSAAARALRTAPGDRTRPPRDEEAQAYTKPPQVALDRAQVKRAWPAIVAEIKKEKASTGQLFATTAADVDGDELIVEFPIGQELTKSLADRPDDKQLLRRAVQIVLGVKPPIRFQIGRGAVRPPEDEGDPSGPSVPEASKAAAEPDDELPGPPEPDVVDMLASEFGDVVVEHHHEDPDGEGRA